MYYSVYDPDIACPILEAWRLAVFVDDHRRTGLLATTLRQA